MPSALVAGYNSSMMTVRSLRRALLGLALAFPLAAATRPIHLHLEKSDPAEGATVAAPGAIQLWFTQAPELAATRITLTSAAGDTVPTGAATRGTEAKAPIAFAVKKAMADGAYTVAWRTVGADGHTVRGTFTFTVKAGSR